jgi:hypothetical protein
MGAQPSELGGAERPKLRSPIGPAYARLGSVMEIPAHYLNTGG